MATVEMSVDEGVATVVLNRPEARNALDVDMREELVEAWAEAHRRPEVRALLLTGAGEVAFCAGADLKDTRLDTTEYLAEEAFGSPPAAHFMRRMPDEKPVVCAINGHALGGGLELALACDIRLASTQATLGMAEVRVGSMPGAGGTQYLPRLVGGSDAMYLLLTGARVTAPEAVRMRLVSECLSPSSLRERATEIARQIAANAPLAVRATRRAARASADLPLARGLEFERDLWGLVRASEDRAEGRVAFREGRAPVFRGR